MDDQTTRVLGTGSYFAHWVQRSNLIKLTARGTLPCANYEAALEMGPEDVDPPIHYLYFFVQPFCLLAMKPFEKTAVFPAAPDTTKAVTVIDASGNHEIPVLPAMAEGELGTWLQERDTYTVYAKLPKSDPPSGCVVVPSDFVVSAIHYKVFGPDSIEKCDEFVAKSCAKAAVKALRGGEIPWPLAE